MSLRSSLSRLIGVGLLLILPLSCFVTATAFANPSPEPREFLLSNGMKVLLVEVPKAPVVTVQVWYKVGSRNEVMGRAGLSHMLEHMMFNGTSKYPKGTFSRLIKKNGGVVNVTFIPLFVSAETAVWGKGLEISMFNAKTGAEMEKIQKDYVAAHGAPPSSEA